MSNVKAGSLPRSVLVQTDGGHARWSQGLPRYTDRESKFVYGTVIAAGIGFFPLIATRPHTTRKRVALIATIPT